jgi:hypothetical protein
VIKFLISLGTVCLLFLAIFLTGVPKKSFSFYAKEYCSCYYVLERDTKFCHSVQQASVPRINFHHDYKNKIISVGLFTKSYAQFISNRYGCQLIEGIEAVP